MNSSMRQLFLTLLFILALSVGTLAQSSPPLTIKEADGSPRVTYPTELIFPNGKLTRSGQKITVTFGTGSFVVGPASATGNAIVRFDLTTGKLVQNSVITIADTSGNMAGVGTLNTHTIPSGTDTFALLAATQALTGKTINGNTFTSGTYTLTGAAGKTFTFSNTLTLAGTDGSTLDMGTGGTLGSNAFNSTEYLPLAGGTLSGAVNIAVTGVVGLKVSDAADANNQRVQLGVSNGNGGYAVLYDVAEAATATIRGYAVSGVQAYFTAGNVGIGTTEPQSTLHVNGSLRWGGGGSNGTTKPYVESAIDANGLYIEHSGTNTSNENIRIQASTSGGGVNYSQFIMDPTSGFAFTTIGLGNGNVGIGTTAPAGLLHVSSDTAATGLSFVTQANASADGFDQNFRKARGTGAAPTVITTADELGVINFTGYGGAAGYIAGAAIKGISSGTIADSRVPGQLSFWTGTDAAPSVLTERMTILNSGNVGIGTVAPLSKLQVGSITATTGNLPDIANNIGVFAGTPLFSEPNGPGQIMLIDNTALAADRGGRITFAARTDGSTEMAALANIGGFKENATASNYAGYLQFMTRGAAGSNAEAMRITSTGNVGIATTAPDKALEVNLGTTSAFRLTYNDANGSAANYTDFTVDSVGSLTVAPAGTNPNISLTPGGTGGLIFGGGTPITKHLSATATLDFASLVAAGCEDLTITVTGAAVGDTVSIGVPNASVVANGAFSAWVSSADTATIRFCTVVSGDPASGVFRADVWKH